MARAARDAAAGVEGHGHGGATVRVVGRAVAAGRAGAERALDRPPRLAEVDGAQARGGVQGERRGGGGEGERQEGGGEAGGERAHRAAR